MKAEIQRTTRDSDVLWEARATWLIGLNTYIMTGIISILCFFALRFLDYNYPALYEIFLPVSLIVIFIMIVRSVIIYLGAYCEKYTITQKELIVKKGIFNVDEEYLELIRIRDVSTKIPYYLAPFNRANLYVYSPSDASTPVTVLKGVENYRQIEQTLTKLAREILSKSAPVIGG